MTHRYFGFNDRPFAAAPRCESWFAAESPEAALHGTLRCLERAEGIAAVIAPPGMGKTTLLQVVAARLRKTCKVAVLEAGHLTTRRDLLQAILHELDFPVHGRDEGDLRLALLDGLSAPKAAPLAILCDEAHTLPSKLLEELRLLTNVVRNGEAKVRLLLVGGPALDERLGHPKLESLQQRIAARSYLHPWSRTETREYVRAQIQRVGGSPERVFTPDALDAVFRASDGVPRLINQICDHALVMAHASNVSTLDKRAIETAWADLQQLPPPSHAAPFGACPAVETIEFGLLDDDAECFGEDEIIVPTNNIPIELIDRRFHGEESLSPRLFDEPLRAAETFDEEPEYEFLAEATTDAPFRPRVARPEDGLEESDFSEHEFDEQSTPVAEFSEEEGLDEIVFDESYLLRRIETVEIQLRGLNDDVFAVDPPTEPTPTPTPSPSPQPTVNPFSETFIEEEIVLDPYLDQSLELFSNKPLVETFTLPRLAATPANVEGPAIAERPIVAERVEKANSAPVIPSQATTTEFHTIELVFPADSVGMTQFAALNAAPTKQTDSIIAASSHVANPPSRSQPIPTAHNDDEVIVIEESDVTAECPRVERREYRQLFAKLRRG